MHNLPFCIALFGALLLGSATGYTHELWFEPEGSGMALHYGDFGRNMRERSPGVNDRWGLLTATLVTSGGEKPQTLQKQGGLPELPRARETLPASMLAAPKPDRH